MGNILKNEIDCTCEDFLFDIYGARSKPCTAAMKTLLTAVVTGGSTLVKGLSSSLRKDGGKSESKRTQEMVSRWLMNYDFSEKLNDHLLGLASSLVSDRTTLAIDFSDISKEFGGAGMEGMENGWDGSRHCVAMGHDFVCVSVVGADFRDAQPVYVKLGKGRHDKEDLLRVAIDEIMSKTGGRGWMVCDRGMDDAKFIYRMKRDARTVVVRVKDMKRDVFGNGKDIDETLNAAKFGSVMLNTYRGARKAEVRYAVGTMQYCADPRSKLAETHATRLLVVESRFDGKSIYMYVVCPGEVVDDPHLAWAFAVRAAQAYCDRWQIEASFQTVKREFSLEKARVRKFKRLENIFSLCMLAYVFATRYLRLSKRFGRIVKVLGDNVSELALKTHSLLAGIRDLYGEHRVRFITGRPRKAPVSDGRQLQFAFAEA